MPAWVILRALDRSSLSKKLNLYRQDYCGCEFSLAQGNSLETKKEKTLK